MPKVTNPKQKILDFVISFKFSYKILCDGLTDVPNYFEIFIDGGQKYPEFTGIYYPKNDSGIEIMRHTLDTEKLKKDGVSVVSIAKKYKAVKKSFRLDEINDPYYQLIEIKSQVLKGDFLNLLLGLSKEGYLLTGDIEFE